MLLLFPFPPPRQGGLAGTLSALGWSEICGSCLSAFRPAEATEGDCVGILPCPYLCHRSHNTKAGQHASRRLFTPTPIVAGKISLD